MTDDAQAQVVRLVRDAVNSLVNRNTSAECNDVCDGAGAVQSPRFSVSARQPKGWTLNTRRVCCTWVRCYQRSKTCPLLLLLRWPSLIRWGLPRMPENGSYGERQNPEPSMGLFCRPPYGGLCRGGGRWSHGCASLAVGYNLPPFGLSQRSLSRRGRA